MREILFKAKRKDNGEWVEGLIWKKKYNSNKIFISCFPDEDDNEEAYVVDSATICQYTGLTDKNGNKIWENDVISYPKIHAKGKVIFMEDTFVLFDEYYGKQYINGMWNAFEVIGNIFDNPELLKGE